MGPGESLVSQIENHRRKREEEQMENELEVPPSCKTRRQKMVGVHVIVFLIGLAIFLFGIAEMIYASSFRRGNTFLPLLFAIVGGCKFEAVKSFFNMHTY